MPEKEEKKEVVGKEEKSVVVAKVEEKKSEKAPEKRGEEVSFCGGRGEEKRKGT